MQNFFRHYSSLSQEQARDLKQNPTGPERKLWFCFLKEQKPRFRQQKIIGPYIVDFYCAERKLAIELDGESHEESAQNDALRSDYLNKLGINVLRFTNQEITEQFEGVCQAIYNVLYDTTPRPASQVTPPERGDGTLVPPFRGLSAKLTGGLLRFYHFIDKRSD